MGILPYSGEPSAERPKPVEFPRLLLGEGDDPAGYLPDAGLVDAVNVALILRQPLLVTGEPGTGKSQLARSVAYQLGLNPPLNFETKSTSVAKDLFYSFDNIGRFRAAQQTASEQPVSDFLTFNAVGLAIILANNPDQVRGYLPRDFVHPGQCRSVVLIDEVDKAPRDFPNDILNEVERFFFRVPEAGGALISADDQFRPVVIITSNSEKSLPDAFLRRCVFYSIPFPDERRLENIVHTRLARRMSEGTTFMKEAIQFFMELRAPESGLRKKPGTAELLNWIVALLEFGCSATVSIKDQGPVAHRTLSALSKFMEDQDRIAERFTQWTRG